MFVIFNVFCLFSWIINTHCNNCEDIVRSSCSVIIAYGSGQLYKKKKSYHVDDLLKTQLFVINVPCRKNTRWNSGFAWFIRFSIWNLFHVQIALKGHALHSKIYSKIWKCILSDILCTGSDVNFWRWYFPINSIDRFHVTSSKF